MFEVVLKTRRLGLDNRKHLWSVFYEINNPEVILIGGAAVCIAITDVILAHISFNYSNNGFIYFFCDDHNDDGDPVGGGKGCAQPPLYPQLFSLSSLPSSSLSLSSRRIIITFTISKLN